VVLVRPLFLFLFSVVVTMASPDVTMFQRSSTYVMSLKYGIPAVIGGSFKNFYEIHMAMKNIYLLG